MDDVCVPTTLDGVIFDGNGTGDCTIDVNVDILGLDVQSGYTGNITQGTSSISVGDGNDGEGACAAVFGGATFTGGTFIGGSGEIDINSFLTINGNDFTATSGNLSVSGDFIISGESTPVETCIDATVDTWIDINNQGDYNSNDTTVILDGDPDRSVLVKWDLSSISANATVSSVKISLQVQQFHCGHVRDL